MAHEETLTKAGVVFCQKAYTAFPELQLESLDLHYSDEDLALASEGQVRMKIAEDAIFPEEKLTRYLLLPRQKNDKSRFLAQAGFTRENPDILDKAIRQLIAENDAIPDRHNDYGTFYLVEGELKGPRRGTLAAVTV